MRDVLLVILLVALLPLILRRPQLGVVAWIYFSVLNPHRFTWSFAYEFRFAAVIGVITLIGAVFSKDLKRPPLNTLSVAMLLFAGWICITTAFAIDPAASSERWAAMMKTMAVAFLIPMLFHKKEDLNLLIWAVVLSIAFYGVKGGFWTLYTGGSIRIFGPPESYIADNNAIAVAIVMAIPLMVYLQLTTSKRFVRWSLTAMMLLCGIAVLGTYSRGAVVAIAAMVLFLWWRSRRRIPLLLVLIFVVPVALSVMPAKWYERMETIGNYQEDGSAQMRLNSWGTMVNIAKDRPLTGAGFAVASPGVYERYSPDPSFPPQVAHSIYFEALGGHGFVGLGLYLFLLYAFWSKAGTVSRIGTDRSDVAWAGHLALMTQVTLVGFAVGGAFLSILSFDVPYYLAAIVVATAALVEKKRDVRYAAVSEATDSLIKVARPSEPATKSRL